MKGIYFRPNTKEVIFEIYDLLAQVLQKWGLGDLCRKDYKKVAPSLDKDRLRVQNHKLPLSLAGLPV
jgi:hypothetical protein